VAVKSFYAADQPDLQGAWEGVMLLDETGVQAGEAGRTHVVLKLARTNGVYSATADWIEMGIKEVAMGKVKYRFPSLQIERNPRETWKLTVNADATKMVLDHSIHFTETDPVLLARTATPDSVPEPLTESDFAPRAGSVLQGYWKGVIGPDALPLALRISQTGNAFRAEGDDPMQGANRRPVSVTYSAPTVTARVATGAGMFRGTIDNAGTEIAGSWTQGGQSMPATLRRGDYKVEHAKDPLKDYSFGAKTDLQGHWKGTWTARFGTIKVPIRLTLDIARLPDGSYAAALANIDQFGYDDPIEPSKFVYSPPRLRMEWKWADSVAYEGKLENGKLVGAWLQSGGSFPLTFER
jgi:hypothetical protein